MHRRVFLIALLAAPLLADSQQQVFDLFTKIAAAMSNDDALPFLDAVDREMPQYDVFQANVKALVDQADVTNSIEVLSNSGDDAHRSEELDWFMQIVGKSEDHPVERRREVVKVSLARRGKKWKIVSIDPIGFFAPPKQP
ncbi:MAG: hypothetical protein U0Q18_09135 [Bryobacteraceae bacterium]